MERKRGLSPIIAVLLLILLATVLVALIFGWGRFFFEEKQVGLEGKSLADQLNLGDLSLEGCLESEFQINKVSKDPLDNFFEITNRGNKKLIGLDVRLIKGGNFLTKGFLVDIDPGKSSVASIDFMLEGSIIPDKIIFYPVFIDGINLEKGEGYAYCEGKEHIFTS